MIGNWVVAGRRRETTTPALGFGAAKSSAIAGWQQGRNAPAASESMSFFAPGLI